MKHYSELKTDAEKQQHAFSVWLRREYYDKGWKPKDILKVKDRIKELFWAKIGDRIKYEDQYQLLITKPKFKVIEK